MEIFYQKFKHPKTLLKHLEKIEDPIKYLTKPDKLEQYKTNPNYREGLPKTCQKEEKNPGEEELKDSDG